MPSVPKPASKPVAYGLLVFIMFIWASAFAGLRLVLRELDWVTLTMMRMMFAAGALLVAGRSSWARQFHAETRLVEGRAHRPARVYACTTWP